MGPDHRMSFVAHARGICKLDTSRVNQWLITSQTKQMPNKVLENTTISTYTHQ